METDRTGGYVLRSALAALVVVLGLGLAGCGTGPLVGMAYTRVRLPLTRDLRAVPAPAHPPGADAVIEIKEPVSGFGMYIRANSNALGDIARREGIDPLHFADQEVFNILGIFKSERVFLYGVRKPASKPEGSGNVQP